MKVMVFCGKRYAARRALDTMLDYGMNIVGCVFEEACPIEFSDFCKRHDIPVYTDKQLYEALKLGTFPQFDIGISYLYHRILKESIIEFANQNIINFHPAPTEIHRGIAPSCWCLLNGYKEWAVTAHYLTLGVDEGDIIKQRWFSIEHIRTAVEAEAYIQKQSIELLKEVLELLQSSGGGSALPRRKQDLSKGCYFGRKELESEKIINNADDTDVIDHKIRSLWMPPHMGVYTEIGGKKYSLVDEEIMREITEMYRKAKLYDAAHE